MNNNIEDLRHIRSMMERSTKFLSISGISGVLAGTFAIIGAIIAHYAIKGNIVITENLICDLLIIAAVVLFMAVSAGLYFSARKAKKNNAKLWSPLTLQIAKDLCIPLFSGGVFCLILIYNRCGYLVGSATLVFYGISLIAAGNRTYRDIKILGACEIILGFIAGVSIGYGLIIWAIGFGVLHIVYGIVIYYKYDSGRNKKQTAA
ncbi:hypothetical protein [Dysgonomonas sp. 520]|uniref:hypothetical protein n=1 Tax=Dysgonomonas sp. 520 TaxID=2302931 RepID=UPI0013D24111|nr:hypothetical protein [Dysgonomonas sp. 520]NDW10637.1 hypothetical protein [Dysgonomonas sp. 520]